VKLGRTLTIFFLTTVAFVSLAASQAYAQLLEDHKVIQSSGDRTVIQSSKVVRTYGWQNGLVEREHNLGNFFWAPQSRRIDSSRVLSRTTPAPIQPVKKFHYQKPVHIATPVPGRPAMSPGESRSSDLNGRLTQPDVPAPVSVPVKVASYGSSYGSDSRSSSHTQSSALLTSESVHGQLKLAKPARAPQAARAVGGHR